MNDGYIAEEEGIDQFDIEEVRTLYRTAQYQKLVGLSYDQLMNEPTEWIEFVLLAERIEQKRITKLSKENG